ncbi:hypothetical protein [Williamsia sp. CHRR-6]|uniref:hypothetical protein n=1 Tax=Williamsia sp. CHRR-6 TaxID=2835871 RepID=UPI001BDA1002|nr:hypothetical protein [Williamsia sp. CHRR-6]MBT0566195.1 hypothetical protein [Williamsia sp. CHRR-6]
MTSPAPAWEHATHVLVRELHGEDYELPPRVQVGHTVIGMLATSTWAIEGVYLATAGLNGVDLTLTEPLVPHCGVSVPALELRMREPVPRVANTPHPQWANRMLAAIAAEVISPTPWYRLDHSCAGHHLGEYDLLTARTWGCNTCGRDPATEYAPRFEAHATGMRLDPSIDLDITIAVCPSCHEILHQPIAPSVNELMYGLRPECPQCGDRQADVVTLNTALPAPVGVIALAELNPAEAPDFVCRHCHHQW